MDMLSMKIVFMPEDLEGDLEQVEAIITVRLMRAKLEFMEFIEKARTVPTQKTKEA